MADLNIRDFPEQLLAALKAQAALRKTTLRDYVIDICCKAEAENSPGVAFAAAAMTGMLQGHPHDNFKVGLENMAGGANVPSQTEMAMRRYVSADGTVRVPLPKRYPQHAVNCRCFRCKPPVKP